MTKQFKQQYWKVVVFTFCLGWAVIWVYRSILSPIYGEIQGTIGEQSNAAMGLIASCYFFGYTAMQIPSGFLVDRFGQKRILIPGFIVFAIGALCVASGLSLTALYLGSVLAGVGCGTYYGSAFSLTAQHVPPEKKGLATAIVNSGSALGMIIGMTGSSFIVKQLQLPWQAIVVISAALIVALVIWFAVAIRDNKAEKDALRQAAAPAAAPVGPAGAVEPAAAAALEDSASAAPAPSAPAPATASAPARTPARTPSAPRTGIRLFSPQLIACYLLYFTTCYAYYMIVTWLPRFLEAERGITGGLIGLIVSMIAVTAVPGGLFFAHLSDKKRGKKVFIIIGLEIAAFLLVAVAMFAPNAPVLALILLFYGFLGKMAVDPVLISYVTDRADPRNTAKTLGTFNFFGMSSSIVAPALTGLIIDVTGSGELGFYLGAALLLVGTVLFFLFNARSLRSTAQADA
jgi:MFS family permease